MEKYKPFKIESHDKSFYCLSSKKSKDEKETLEFDVVLTSEIFKTRMHVEKLNHIKESLELTLKRKKEEYDFVLNKINTLIDTGMKLQDEEKLDVITNLVKEQKSKKLFLQQEINAAQTKINNITVEISYSKPKNESIITKYKLDSGHKCKHIAYDKEDEEDLKDTLERFGCLAD